jgi:predicted AAA+ superfamily ATPase
MMNREIASVLQEWLVSPRRKPVVIRGARQVGKTWTVRALAASAGLHLVEVNFERYPELAELFLEKSPEKVLSTLERVKGERIDKATSLLFLDEIQKAPHAFANLRWFHEECPELPVVATGSLLDFVLKEHEFSMPVGRISYLFMEPMSFKEFLQASGDDMLAEYLEQFAIGSEMAAPVHERLMASFRDYLVVGGMPAAVSEWVTTKSPMAVAEVHQDLINTFMDDFSKYVGRIPPQRLRNVVMAVPRLLGQKFKFSNVDRDETAKAMRRALDLLCTARLCHRVVHSSARGVPLAAQENEKMFKVMLLDSGLVAALQGVVLRTEKELREIIRVNEGGISEQVVGQLLRAGTVKFIDPHLHYYVREKRGAESEIDYLMQHRTNVVPIEVKSGATGSLKSLHQFMADRELAIAVRVNSERPTVTHVDMLTPAGSRAQYELVSIPFYLVSEIERLLTAAT